MFSIIKKNPIQEKKIHSKTEKNSIQKTKKIPSIPKYSIEYKKIFHWMHKKLKNIPLKKIYGYETLENHTSIKKVTHNHLKRILLTQN